MTRRILSMAVVLLALPGAALANDSIAGLGAGGLIIGRTDAISMQSEDLFLSLDEVKVDYVFMNSSDADVETIVAFPMPDIAANPYTMPNLPDNAADNFLDFEVTVDGKPIKAELEQRAVAVGVDVTEELKANGIPVNPFAPPAFSALEKLPENVAKDWIDRGMLFIDSYDDGSGWKNVRTPTWTLKSAYWWKTNFPRDRTVKVFHRYRPSVGESVGMNFFYDNRFQDIWPETKARYCADEAFERAVLKAAKESGDGFPRLSESKLQYVLTTGGNWATGTIGRFHLTVDKGDERNIISLCGQGLRKTGPTRFELNASEYLPARDLDVLILKPYADSDRGGAVTKPDRKRRTPIPGKSN